MGAWVVVYPLLPSMPPYSGDGGMIMAAERRRDSWEISHLSAGNYTFGSVDGDLIQARDVHFNSATLGSSEILVAHQLPAIIGDFTGRVGDLAQLDTLMSTQDGGSAISRGPMVVITAIDGTAGVGKTTLAVYWAHRLRHRFPDGQLFVNLRGYDSGPPAKPADVLDSFLRALGVSREQIPAAAEEREAMYRSLLDGRRVLILLDNANSPDQVRPLLPASSTCMVIITSRSSLTGLAVTAAAVRVSLDLLPLDDAVALLRTIIGSRRADADPDSVTKLAFACARLPLALRIAAHRAAARPHVEIASLSRI